MVIPFSTNSSWQHTLWYNDIVQRPVSKLQCQLQPSCVPSWALPLSALRSHWGAPGHFNWGYFCQLHPPKREPKIISISPCWWMMWFLSSSFWIWTFHPMESPVNRLLFLFRGWTRRSSTAWAMNQWWHHLWGAMTHSLKNLRCPPEATFS